MSRSGSELAIFNARNVLLLPPTQGTIYLYELSGGTMRQTTALPVPMAEGDFFFGPKVRLEGDRLLVWKSTPPGGGGIFFKRGATGVRLLTSGIPSPASFQIISSMWREMRWSSMAAWERISTRHPSHRVS